MIAVADHAEGCVLPVRGAAGRAAGQGAQGEQAAPGSLKVAVTAPPQDGRANEALVEALRKALAVRRSQVELLGGATGRDKRFLIRGLTRAELERRVAVLVNG